MRSHGSDGGHNGMASIIYSLEADEIPRLRIGIGGKELPIDHSHDAMAEYVLSPFSAEEEKELPLFCDFAAHACSSWLDQGINKTMSMFNKKFFSDPKIGS
jgi:PTH1 family peptidyl-tRNA hydrolase